MHTYDGIPISRIRKPAAEELFRLNMTLTDVVEILETGFNCARSRRKAGILERCVFKGGKVRKVVVEKKMTANGFEYWEIRHAGEFGVKRGRFGGGSL